MTINTESIWSKKKSNCPYSKGITLIEILLIIMLLSIFSSIFYRIYLSTTEIPRYDKTKQAILTIENALKFYKLNNGFYPTNAQGINSLIIKPTTEPIPMNWSKYLQTLPLDQWGQPYHYKIPGSHKVIEIYSDGPPK